MSEISTAVVGATGAVGREMLATLERRKFPVGQLRLMASERSAGTVVETAWGDVTVEDLAVADPTGIEIALFSAGGARSKEHARRFADVGAVVVDNSSAWRMDPTVPLVVADVNNQYQSVSGSGQSGIATLLDEVEHFGKDTDALRTGLWQEPPAGLYDRPIGWNVLPLAGSLMSDGYTDEELKLVHETRKILGAPDVRVEPTCVRVPVMVSHGIAASVWFERDLGVDEAAELIAAAPGVELWSDKVPTPIDAAGVDEVLVGRLRATLGRPGGVSFWVVGDNLRKGAALNAVQIAELVAG
jgi:aspartate-semialdehyde dehydrogenase